MWTTNPINSKHLMNMKRNITSWVKSTRKKSCLFYQVFKIIISEIADRKFGQLSYFQDYVPLWGSLLQFLLHRVRFLLFWGEYRPHFHNFYDLPRHHIDLDFKQELLCWQQGDHLGRVLFLSPLYSRKIVCVFVCDHSLTIFVVGDLRTYSSI